MNTIDVTGSLASAMAGNESSTVTDSEYGEADTTASDTDDHGPYYVPGLKKNAQNIATQLTADQLSTLGARCVEDYDSDVSSCSDYMRARADYTKAFAGKMEQRTDGVANIHVPLITVGVSQFQARALEAIVTTRGLVNIKATGAEDEERAERVSNHMNFQLQHQVEDFLQEMDICLTEEGLYGSVFRKVYWDTGKNRIAITTVPSSDVVLSYTYRGPIENCRRITQVLRMTKDDIRVRVRDGVFCECGWDLSGTSNTFSENAPKAEAERTDGITKVQPARDEDGMREVLEQHCRIDLEGTGVQQPYVVTVDYETRKVLRITSREYVDEDGEAKEICYWVHYMFMPGPGFYGQGLGALLMGLQASADALVNQLVDAGTYQNNPVHLVSERSNMPKGSIWTERGKMIPVDAMAEDLRHAIFRIDFPPPSPVLAQLLEKVQDWAQRISSVTDLLSGLPQQTNQTATTTLTLAEQGLKMFSAVHKRTRAAFTNELKLIYLMNRIHLSDDEYSRVQGESSDAYKQWKQSKDMQAQIKPMLEAAYRGDPQAIANMNQIPPPQLKAIMSVPDHPFSVALDYRSGVDCIPVADPEVSSRAEKLTLAKEAFQVMMSVPSAAQDPAAVREGAYRMMAALGVQDIDKVLPPIPEPMAPPDLPAEVENANFFREQPAFMPPGKPGPYHEEHLKVMEVFDREGWLKQLTPGGQKLFDQHRREHLAAEYLIDHQKQKQLMGGGPNGQVLEGSGAGPLPGGGNAGVGLVDPSALLSADAGAGGAADHTRASLQGRFPALADLANPG